MGASVLWVLKSVWGDDHVRCAHPDPLSDAIPRHSTNDQGEDDRPEKLLEAELLSSLLSSGAGNGHAVSHENVDCIGRCFGVYSAFPDFNLLYIA